MELGAFSVSLSVQDMERSRSFYESLGFTEVGGDGVSWLILSNRGTTIGLFHGLFEGNILTFNPGWSGEGDDLDNFTDMRSIRDSVVAAGIEVAEDTTQDSAEGPASFMFLDPDGNPILVDQYR